MKISVKVKPQAKQDKIEKTDLNDYAVWVKAKAIEGKRDSNLVRFARLAAQPQDLS